MPADNEWLEQGEVLVAEVAAPCPVCNLPIGYPVHFSIQNTLPISMILWTHPEAVKCKHCESIVVPFIQAFNKNSFKWAFSKVATGKRPLVNLPNAMDISQILKSKGN